MKILVIEDDSNIRETLKLVLESENHEVHTATDGIAGLKSLAQLETPDLIMTDIIMPKMGGLEFLNSLQSYPEYAKIPVIFLSGEELPQEINQPFLIKPFSIDDLIELLSQYTAQSFAQAA